MSPTKLPVWMRVIVLAVAVVVLGAAGIGIALTVQDQWTKYARRRDEARLNEIANQRVDEARKNGTLWMGAGKEPDLNPPVRKTSKDPLVQGVDWEIVPPHLNRLGLETPLEPTVSPPTDLETRFAATFGPVGRAKARVDVSPDARTATDFETEYLAYRLRDVNTYLAGTRDTGEAKVAGERFLRAAIEQFSHVDRTGGDSRDEARALGVAALALGSDDALVRSYYADIVNDGTTWSAPTVFRIVESTIRSLEPGRYPAFVEVRLRTTLQHVVDEGAIPDEMARTAAFHAATARWLREASVNPEDGRYVWRRLNNVMNVPQSHWEDLFRRVLHEKTVNPWLLRMIAARHYDKLAWRARGHGMAGSVTGEGWKNFEIGLNRAADLYREAWLMHPERPESAMAMILIATANGGKFGTPADWFEKAIAAECDRFGVYWDYGSSLLPRWGGSHEELFEFHRACLDTGRFDTFVPTIFLGLLEHLELHEQVERERMFEQLPGLEAACVEFVRALTNAPPGPHAERLRRDRIGRDGHAILLDVLARAGHADEARTLALEYPADGSPARMDERGGAGLFDFSRVRATTNANKADVEDLVDKLVKAPLSTMPDESAVRAKIAGLRAAKDPHAEPFLSALDELLKQRQAWSQGEWVEIDPTTDTKTLEYEGHVGRVRYEDGLRELIGDKRRIAQIGTGFLLPFSIPFEVEAILDSKPEKIGSNAGGLEGAGFQWMPAVDVALPWTIDEAFRNTERAHPFVGYSKHGFAGYRLPPDLSGRTYEYAPVETGPVRARWRVWPEKYEFAWNERAGTGDFTTPLDPRGRLWVGEPLAVAGMHSRTISQGHIHLGRIRIRQLREPAPPLLSSPFDERLAYWKSRHEQAPEDAVACLELAAMYTESQPELVLPLAEESRRTRPGARGWDLLLGRALRRMGRWAEAEKALRRSLAASDSMEAAVVEMRRIGVEKDGARSNAPSEQLVPDLEGRGAVDDTWAFEYASLRRFAEYNAAEQRGQSTPTALAQILNLSVSSLARAISLASPGPRRDDMSSRLAQYEELKRKFSVSADDHPNR